MLVAINGLGLWVLKSEKERESESNFPIAGSN